jgi:hypothetical protein
LQGLRGGGRPIGDLEEARGIVADQWRIVLIRRDDMASVAFVARKFVSGLCIAPMYRLLRTAATGARNKPKTVTLASLTISISSVSDYLPTTPILSAPDR